MRQISIVTATVWIAVIAALFGASSMIARVPHPAEIAASSSQIDIPQMTRGAKNLPVEQFDAH